MKLQLQEGLLFVTLTAAYHGQAAELNRVLLDTGSAGTLLSTERLVAIGVQMEPNDIIQRIGGIGGSEFVFTKRMDVLASGDLAVHDFEVEVGALNYGFEMGG